MPARERPGNAFGQCVPLVADRLGEGSRAGATSRSGEAIARKDLRRSNELGNEIGDRLEPCCARRFSPSLARPGAIAEIG